MYKKLSGGLLVALLFALMTPGLTMAQDFDCAAYENYAGAEPVGWAENCMQEGLGAVNAPAGPGGTEAPTDTAFAHDIGFISDNTIEHQQGDLSTSVIVGASSAAIFGYDYSPDLSTLYAINNDTGQLGTFNGSTFTPIGSPTNPGGHTWTGLAINPVTGEAYLSSTSGSVSTLHSVDLATGNSTVIGNFGLALAIDIAMNCDGEMYTHDIGRDAIFSVDLGTGAATLVGSTGLNANFAQGMDFDNESGELYIHGYTGGGTNTYGTVDLTTGAITPLNVDNPLGEFEGASQTTCDGTGEGPARFQVSKFFNDGNTAEVDVVIQCNTGLPLMQPASISEGDPVTFVVGDFEDGAMTCTVTESVPAGYTASYDNGEAVTDTGCVFEAVGLGSFNTCDITNSLNEVDIEVTKVWIDENPQFNPVNYAEAAWSCSNVAFACPDGGDNDCDSGVLEFLGNPATDGFSVFPRWDGATTCSVDEVIISDGNVEVDDSECNSITLFPGVGGECTIYNTRLYAGIPTLSQYGLAIMALLMLGLGLVGFRRFV